MPNHPTTVRTPAVEYRIDWCWRWDQGATYLPDHESATNVERAIAKFRKRLAEEYSFAKSDLIIKQVAIV